VPSRQYCFSRKSGGRRDVPVVVRQREDVNDGMEGEDDEEEVAEVVELFDEEVPGEGNGRGQVGDDETASELERQRATRAEPGRKGRGREVDGRGQEG
jgi:hypothetical protein